MRTSTIVCATWVMTIWLRVYAVLGQISPIDHTLVISERKWVRCLICMNSYETIVSIIVTELYVSQMSIGPKNSFCDQI
ncbi:hypothetical protein BpHYR1_051171 [Brachionus plicatilis]|uniref:Secreted protein n=1 Tax=Brachionus plicatilis TaxID=10195 RepID=A0A3M7RHQ5_BRAPC|nr:hypothetical protein BpHYR1_051171 [Brachionus plicatilis]